MPALAPCVIFHQARLSNRFWLLLAAGLPPGKHVGSCSLLYFIISLLCNLREECIAITSFKCHMSYLTVVVATKCTGSPTQCTGSLTTCTGSSLPHCTGSPATCTGSLTQCTGSATQFTVSPAVCAGFPVTPFQIPCICRYMVIS